MTRVATNDAEMKNVQESNAKHTLAPRRSMTRPMAAGAMICESCCACDINPLAATRAFAGVMARIATVCAGTKKLDMQLIRNTVP